MDEPATCLRVVCWFVPIFILPVTTTPGRKFKRRAHQKRMARKASIMDHHKLGEMTLMEISSDMR